MTALLLAAALASPFDAAWDYNLRMSGRTMVVMREGKVLYENYGRGGSRETKQMLASGSKSFVGVAAMMMAEEGRIRLDSPVSDALPDWKSDPRKAMITWRQLLNLSSGLAPIQAIRTIPTWEAAAGQSAVNEPGATFRYGPVHFLAIGCAAEKVLGGESFEAYMNRKIFQPLGITVEWKMRGADGRPQLAGGAHMTARDWAAFGEMVRAGGVWQGKRLVKQELLAECFRPSSARPDYGLTWWLSPGADVRGTGAQPKPGFAMAAGAGNQRLYVLSQEGLVVVRQAQGMSRGWDDQAFLDLVLKAVKGG